MERETRNVYRAGTHTRVLVAFYAHSGNGLSIAEPVQSHPQLGTVIGLQTDKTMGGASGTWSLTFKKAATTGSRSALRDLWPDPEGVWVDIKVQVDGQLVHTVRGIVDALNESTMRAGMGQRTEVYTISGRDFGKVFETTELWVNFFHNADSALRSAGALTSTFLDQIIGTPEHFVRVLLEEWVGNSGTATAQWMLPPGLGGGSFYSTLQDGGRVRGIESMERIANGEAVAPSLFQIDQTGGGLWDVMQEYANGVMNELFVDLGPRDGAGPKDLSSLVPKVYLRERPFPTRARDGRTTSRTKWNQLRTHVLDPIDVRGRAIAKGGSSHRFNYWLLQLEGIGTEGFNIAEILQRGTDGVAYGQPGNIPIFNDESIQRHGLRRFLATTRFIPLRTVGAQGPDSEAEMFFRLAATWLKKLHDWYAPAPMELSGSITTTRILPEVRVGERVQERRAEGTITYYVEGVSHTYEYPNAGATRLTLTRGEYDDEDLLDRVYEAYSNPLALSEREACLVADGAELDEFLDQVADGCRFDTPTRGDVVGLTTREDQLAHVEGDDFTIASEGQRTLEVERDGSSAREPEPDGAAIQDPGMARTLDDSDPSIGDASEVPTPDADASEGVFDQGTLERQEPIPVESDDPLAGIGEVGF